MMIDLLFVPISVIVNKWVRNFILVSFVMFLVQQMGLRIVWPRRVSKGAFMETRVMVIFIFVEDLVL